MISDMTRYGTQLCRVFGEGGLNFARVEFLDSKVPSKSDDDQAERIAYATRTPKNGRARVKPPSSFKL